MPVDVAIHRQRLNQQATSGKLWRMPNRPSLTFPARLPAPACRSPSPAISGTRPKPPSSPPHSLALPSPATRRNLVLDQTGRPGEGRGVFCFSERLTADQAEKLVLVDAVYPAGEHEKEVMDRARRLAEGPSIAYRYMKENLDRAVHGNLEECMDLEVARHIHTGLTEDHWEAAQAFVQKREIRFRAADATMRTVRPLSAPAAASKSGMRSWTRHRSPTTPAVWKSTDALGSYSG